jgi:hypothetical protein
MRRLLNAEEIDLIRALDNLRRTHQAEAEARARAMAEAHTSRGVAATEYVGVGVHREASVEVEETAALSNHGTIRNGAARAAGVSGAMASQSTRNHRVGRSLWGVSEEILAPCPVSLHVPGYKLS